MRQIIIRDVSQLDKLREHIGDEMSQLKSGVAYRVTIEPNNVRRSNAQNNLFQKWVRILANHIGCPESEMRGALKVMQWGEVEYTCPFTGATRRRVPNSSDKSTKEFRKLLELTDREAASIGIILPKPIDLGR